MREHFETKIEGKGRRSPASYDTLTTGWVCKLMGSVLRNGSMATSAAVGLHQFAVLGDGDPTADDLRELSFASVSS